MPQVEREGRTLGLSLHHIMIGGPLAGLVDHHQAQCLHQVLQLSGFPDLKTCMLIFNIQIIGMVPRVKQLSGWIVALWRRKLPAGLGVGHIKGNPFIKNALNHIKMY